MQCSGPAPSSNDSDPEQDIKAYSCGQTCKHSDANASNIEHARCITATPAISSIHWRVGSARNQSVVMMENGLVPAATVAGLMALSAPPGPIVYCDTSTPSFAT
jgi:hypothetical protein